MKSATKCNRMRPIVPLNDRKAAVLPFIYVSDANQPRNDSRFNSDCLSTHVLLTAHDNEYNASFTGNISDPAMP